MSKVNFNNVYLDLANGNKLSIAQHYDEFGELLACAMAVICETGCSEPLRFLPRLTDFLDVLGHAIKETK